MNKDDEGAGSDSMIGTGQSSEGDPMGVREGTNWMERTAGQEDRLFNV